VSVPSHRLAYVKFVLFAIKDAYFSPDQAQLVVFFFVVRVYYLYLVLAFAFTLSTSDRPSSSRRTPGASLIVRLRAGPRERHRNLEALGCRLSGAEELPTDVRIEVRRLTFFFISPFASFLAQNGDRPWCYDDVKGTWVASPTAVFDYMDDKNAVDGPPDGIDRHDCVALDVDDDGWPDIACLVGANQQKGVGYAELCKCGCPLSFAPLYLFFWFFPPRPCMLVMYGTVVSPPVLSLPCLPDTIILFDQT